MQFALPVKLKDKVKGTNIKDIYKRFKNGEKLYDLSEEYGITIGLLVDKISSYLQKEDIKRSTYKCIIEIL